MEQANPNLQSYLVAGLIPLLLTVGSLFYCPMSVSREVTDHCGRPVNDQQGEPIFELDHWGTWLANWPSTLCILLSILLFTYFLFLDQKDKARKIHQSDFSNLS